MLKTNPAKVVTMTRNQIENQIQDKGLKAPRITPKDIEGNIVGEHYFTAEEGAQGALAKRRPELSMENPSLALLTFSVLVLKNGFTVTGESACASSETFDAEIGRKIARSEERRVGTGCSGRYALKY